MLANLIAARRVLRVVGGDFNEAAIGFQPEVVSGLGVRESHRVVATFVDFVVMLFVTLLLVMLM